MLPRTAVVLLVIFGLWTASCQFLLVSGTRKCTFDCNDSGSSNEQPPNDDSIGEEDIRRELLQLERQRILEKLRLDRPPDVRVSLHDLPAPVTKRLEENPLGDESAAAETAEDAPGRPKSVYIVGERPRRGRGRNHMCTDRSGKPAVCIEFEVNGRSLANQDILNAFLWVSLHFEHDGPDSNSISLNLSVAGLRVHEEEIMIGSAEVTSARSGHWVSVNMTDYVRQQLIGRSRTHKITLLVACLGDDCRERPPIAFSHTGRHRPFLELQTRRPEADQGDTRRKRSKLCGPGSTSETECCLETLFVNFTEIGWHTWILQPRGYETGYCKGRCQSTATRNYNAIMRAVLHRRRSEQQPQNAPVDPEMAPCCSPMKMEPLEILYAKIENNHEQLSTAVLPAMIVSSCKC